MEKKYKVNLRIIKYFDRYIYKYLYISNNNNINCINININKDNKKNGRNRRWLRSKLWGLRINDGRIREIREGIQKEWLGYVCSSAILI